MNILVVDAHPLFRSGLTQLLNEMDLRASAFEARDVDEVERSLAMLPELDLVLADPPIPEHEPMRNVQNISDLLVDVPLVIISTKGTREDALEAIEMGAQGFIPKSANREEIEQGIRVVLGGSVFISKLALKTARRPQSIDRKHLHTEELDELTNRQRETFALLAQGLANDQIAEELGISDQTVRGYISVILKTFNLRNRTEAALIADRVMNNTPRNVFRRPQSAS